MVEMLFRPFNFEKWFILGFCSWLATLGKGRGSFLNWNGNWADVPANADVGIADLIDRSREIMVAFGGIIATIVIVCLIAAIGVALFLMWLRARGTFVFLDNVVRNSTEISQPWQALPTP